MKKIGILGGMGPLATANLFEKIILNTKATKDQEHIRIFIDNNTEIPDRTAAILGKGEDPLPMMIESAQILKNAGADFLLVPCNTAHFFIEKVSKVADIPILNMIKSAMDYTIQNYPGIKRVGLLSTDGTISTGIYKNEFNKIGIETIIPKANQQELMFFIYEQIKKGDYPEKPKRLFKAVNELKEMGLEVFILACTELSVAFDMYKLDSSFINPLEIVAKKAILESGYKLR